MSVFFGCIYIYTHTHTHIYTYIYIYIYIYTFKKNKNRSHKGYKFISILLWALICINNTKNNRTSSDLMDKIICQNRRRREGWERVEGGEEFSLHLPSSGFPFYYRLESQ